MQKEIINVTGLVCHHCEARVKNVIESIDGVDSCLASSSEGTISCEFDESKVNKDTLLRAIFDAGYEATE